MSARWFLLLASSLAALVPAACAPVLAQPARSKATALAHAAAVLVDEGKLDEALSLFERAYRLDPAPILLGHMAMTYEKKGDLAEARELYERFIAEEKDAGRLAKGRAHLARVLDRIPGWLVVTVTPPGAWVLVGGKTLTSGTPVMLRRGSYDVEVNRQGHVPVRRTAEVRPGEETRLDIHLTPMQGSLVVLCDVAGAEVVVNGAPVGKVPLAGPLAMLPGRHVVEVAAPGRARFVGAVDVAPGETVRFPVDMGVIPSVRAVRPEPASAKERSIRVPLSLAVSEGFLRYLKTTSRTHVGMEFELGLRFARAPWVPSLGIAWTAESPIAVTVRPGIRWYFGSFPMYVRTAAAAVVTPERAWAFLAGLGGDVPLWKNGFLRIEMYITMWSADVVPMDFAVGFGHGF